MRRTILHAVLPCVLLLACSCELTSKNPVDSGYEIPFGVVFASIPGGTFLMGDVENAGGPDEKPVHTVTVSGFDMSMYEITNTDYAEYLQQALATGDIFISNESAIGGKGPYIGQEFLLFPESYDAVNICWIRYLNGIFLVNSETEYWPVVNVTWYGAKAFARYYGLDLPTEAEWEYACRGGRQYPFGTDDGSINSAKANYHSNYGHPVEVGSTPANPFKLCEMSGNVGEWCHDWYAAYPDGDADNPSGPREGVFKTVRGGGWYQPNDTCRAASRTCAAPDSGSNDLGFRVVRRASPQNN